ncbi:hypothetical protein [Novosphingobium sp. KACC 22771]|uniref:hypothetical protein n=1 Tax=Novosphingobium sp. KACC 22771 TaxID=3025670 RepID=UPI0023667E88|nr:hypothetical protein [Novosphingobium sp. KACC 22771]WDF73379.1 hypothetical protein PQ467_04860 [Novosphingobium sp. KACC 22771]
MRLFLNIAACVLIGAMLVQPMLASHGLSGLTSSNMAMAALGLAGLMLGYRGSSRPRQSEAKPATA